MRQLAAAILLLGLSASIWGDTILVMPPKSDDTLSEDDRIFLQDIAVHGFYSAGVFDVVDNSSRDAVIREQNLGLSGVFDTDDIITIGTLSAAQYGTQINIRLLGNSYSILLKVFDLKTGEAVFSDVSRAGGRSSLDIALIGLIEEFHNQLGVETNLPAERGSPTVTLRDDSYYYLSLAAAVPENTRIVTDQYISQTQLYIDGELIETLPLVLVDTESRSGTLYRTFEIDPGVMRNFEYRSLREELHLSIVCLIGMTNNSSREYVAQFVSSKYQHGLPDSIEGQRGLTALVIYDGDYMIR